MELSDAENRKVANRVVSFDVSIGYEMEEARCPFEADAERERRGDTHACLDAEIEAEADEVRAPAIMRLSTEPNTKAYVE
jgi:hypothetical protein